MEFDWTTIREDRRNQIAFQCHLRASELVDSDSRGRSIFEELARIAELRKSFLRISESWKRITYNTLDTKLSDYDDNEEIAIRFLMWLVLHWPQLYKIRQVPKTLEFQYLRIEEIYAKFLCDYPDLVFTGDVGIDPFRTPVNRSWDTLGYTPSYRESFRLEERTVDFWYENVYSSLKNKEDLEYGCVGSKSWDVESSGDIFLNIHMNLLDHNSLRKRTKESQQYYRNKLIESMR